MPNFELLKRIRLQGLTQREFAKLVGEDESLVSRVVNGIWNLDGARKLKWAKMLKTSVEQLFPKS